VKSRPVAPSVKAGVPRGLSRLILQLLNLDPARRPSSAGHVAAVLRSLESVPPPPHRARWWIAAAVVAFIAVVGLADVLVLRWYAQKSAELAIPSIPPPAKQENPREAEDDGIRVVRLPAPEQDFFSRKTDYKGIPIKAHADVADAALRTAYRRLQTMLANCPAIVDNLVTSGAELHIIGKDQQVSDLPEYRHLKGIPFDGTLTVDQRTRGLGGIFASCGEENLLQLPGDRYAGRDICVHEFAHTVRAYGLSADVRRQLEYQFRRSLGKGLWKNSYAASNDDEFFAEVSMWYFGTEGDTAKLSPRPGRGRDGLKRYDPEAFALIDDIYTGRLPIGKNVYADLMALPADREKSLQSGPSVTHTTVLFVNQTKRPLQVFWLDHQGARKLYHTLEGNSRIVQATYASHPWVIVDGDKVRGIYVPAAEPGRIVIEEREKR
jgi:alpha-glucosidase